MRMPDADEATPRLARLEVAERMREIGQLLSHRPDHAFQARAYEAAADALENLSDAAFAHLLETKALATVPRIGSATARQAEELACGAGTSRMLADLRAEFPAAVVELTNLPGVSLTRAQALRGVLGIEGIDDLEQACLAGRVRTVRGFGAKTEAKLLSAIRAYRSRPKEVLLVDAMVSAELLRRHLLVCEGIAAVEVAGAVRRKAETTDVVTVCVASERPARVLDHAAAYPPLARVDGRDASSLVGRSSQGMRLRVVAGAPAHFGGVLVRATGAEAHLDALASRARDLGVSFEEALRHPTEQDVYRALGLAFVPPELREGLGEVAVASSEAFDGLLEATDVQGAVHCHTVYSDGRDTIEAMARAAKTFGWRYLTITDHSPTASYAGGVTIDRLREQWDEIERVQALVPEVRLLRGTESDILEDGGLDYPDAILERFDVIIASIHARHKLDADAMTARLVRAMRHPCFKVWGHPLGRLVLRRDPIACDVERVLDVAAESRVAIEINGDPYRLDLPPRWIRAARERGLRFVVSSDAHSTRGLQSVDFGVAMARRGGVRRGEVLNALDAEAFMAAVRPAG